MLSKEKLTLLNNFIMSRPLDGLNAFQVNAVLDVLREINETYKEAGDNDDKK